MSDPDLTSTFNQQLNIDTDTDQEEDDEIIITHDLLNETLGYLPEDHPFEALEYVEKIRKIDDISSKISSENAKAIALILLRDYEILELQAELKSAESTLELINVISGGDKHLASNLTKSPAHQMQKIAKIVGAAMSHSELKKIETIPLIELLRECSCNLKPFLVLRSAINALKHKLTKYGISVPEISSQQEIDPILSPLAEPSIRLTNPIENQDIHFDQQRSATVAQTLSHSSILEVDQVQQQNRKNQVSPI